MLPKLWKLIELMKAHPEEIKKNLLRLSQGSVYVIGLGNRQRPQAYIIATRADLYTFELVPAGPDHDSFYQLTVGNMTPASLKTDNIIEIYIPNAAAKVVAAYMEIKALYIAMEGVSKLDSDRAPFFLKGKDLQGIDLKTCATSGQRTGS